VDVLKIAAMVAAIVLVAGSRAATAQSVSISAGGFADVVRFGSTRVETSSTTVPFSLNGTTGGLTLGVGAALGPHAEVRFELGLPGSIPQSFGPEERTASLPFTRTMRVAAEYRSRQGSILLGFLTDRERRFRLGLLGGVALVQERQHFLIVTTPPLPTMPVPDEYTAIAYRAGPLVGADLIVAMTPHISFVPQVRVRTLAASYTFTGQVSTGTLGVSTGASVRWTF
jgi:hypothetical protein